MTSKNNIFMWLSKQNGKFMLYFEITENITYFAKIFQNLIFKPFSSDTLPGYVLAFVRNALVNER